MNLDTARKRWMTQGMVSFLLLGAGLSVVFDAAYRRIAEAHWEIWTAEGTLGLLLLMTGLAFFGSSVRYLVHMDRIAEYSDRRARSRARKEREQVVMKMEAPEDIRLKPVRVGSV